MQRASIHSSTQFQLHVYSCVTFTLFDVTGLWDKLFIGQTIKNKNKAFFFLHFQISTFLTCYSGTSSVISMSLAKGYVYNGMLRLGPPTQKKWNLYFAPMNHASSASHVIISYRLVSNDFESRGIASTSLRNRKYLCVANWRLHHPFDWKSVLMLGKHASVIYKFNLYDLKLGYHALF